MKNKKEKINKEELKKFNELIDFLDNANPEEIYKYFEEKNEFYFDLKSKIVQNLLKKKDKLINLIQFKWIY
jgi:mRNA-degrading endonuclease HigB of HigAB toxin-antitoxin module